MAVRHLTERDKQGFTDALASSTAQQARYMVRELGWTFRDIVDTFPQVSLLSLNRSGITVNEWAGEYSYEETKAAGFSPGEIASAYPEEYQADIETGVAREAEAAREQAAIERERFGFDPALARAAAERYAAAQVAEGAPLRQLMDVRQAAQIDQLRNALAMIGRGRDITPQGLGVYQTAADQYARNLMAAQQQMAQDYYRSLERGVEQETLTPEALQRIQGSSALLTGATPTVTKGAPAAPTAPPKPSAAPAAPVTPAARAAPAFGPLGVTGGTYTGREAAPIGFGVSPLGRIGAARQPRGGTVEPTRRTGRDRYTRGLGQQGVY